MRSVITARAGGAGASARKYLKVPAAGVYRRVVLLPDLLHRIVRLRHACRARPPLISSPPPPPALPQHSPMTCSPPAQSRAGPVSLAAAHGHGEGKGPGDLPHVKPNFRDGHQVASPGAVSLYQCDVRPPMGACAGACGCVTRTLDHQGAPASARISGLCLLTRAAVGAGAETCGGDGPRA